MGQGAALDELHRKDARSETIREWLEYDVRFETLTGGLDWSKSTSAKQRTFHLNLA